MDPCYSTVPGTFDIHPSCIVNRRFGLVTIMSLVLFSYQHSSCTPLVLHSDVIEVR